jgi:hypothetical protein
MVREIAAALVSVNEEGLANRLANAEKFAEQIYCFYPDEDADEYIRLFGELRSYYASAAERGNAMLLYLT